MITIISITFLSCMYIPKESVLLSEELTTMIKAAEVSHIALIDEYIAVRRARVDSFLANKWIPDFMKTFTANSSILDDINDASNMDSASKYLREFSEAAAEQIVDRRTTLYDALGEIEKTMKQAVEGHYDDMLMVNSSLTAHLRAKAKVTATRENLINQIGVIPKDILPLEKINTVVDKIIQYEGELENVQDLIGEAKILMKNGD